MGGMKVLGCWWVVRCSGAGCGVSWGLEIQVSVISVVEWQKESRDWYWEVL